MTITIGSWNSRSLNCLNKTRKLLNMDYSITLTQEVWAPNQNILNILKEKNSFIKSRTDGYGGTMILLNDVRLKALNEPSQINEDSHIMKINIGGDRNIWIASLYINKRSKKNLLDTLAEIQRVVPQKEWQYILIGGDWNVNIRDKEDKVTQTLDIVCKSMGLSITSCGCMRGPNEIDYFVHGNQIKVEQTGSQEMNLSDHNMAWIKIKVDAPSNSLRHSTIPNRKLADDITQFCLNKCQDGTGFLDLIDKKYKYNRRKLLKTIRPKSRNNNLLERLLTSGEEDDALQIVKEYWKEKSEECEDDLLQGRLQKAFKFMKSVTRYHEFKRRDGSIINKVRKDDGTVTTDPEEVNKLVLGHLKTIQSSDKEPYYTNHVPFPSLIALGSSEMDYILSKLFHGKAIAFDAVTDILFNKTNKPVTAIKLADVWKGNLKAHHFDTRLIPLNKVHPDIPTPKDCRPIAVCSALIKILESRVRKRLETYMVEKLHRGQTGFVPGMGITVNQMRLIQRVKDITNNKRHCFGLFIDFSSAYNTILHTKLFEKLQKTLPEEEINLIKAIYSRTNIRLGKHSFTPNIGVAQGSIISPFLFNIYTEDLYQTLEKNADLPYGDLMGYADDLLIICTSLHQLRKSISIIKEWSTENNLQLNAKKSGIIEFLPRCKTYQQLKADSFFEDIPVVAEYKYLGLIVDQKLTLTKQLAYIEEKTNHQRSTLWPLLKAFSLTERINLWTILCRPLIEMLIFPYYAERSTVNINKVHIKVRQTFKKFCLFKKNIDNETIEQLMDYNLHERAGKVVQTTDIKWNARLQHKAPNPNEYPKEKPEKNTIKWLPKELVEFINIKTALCKDCNTPCNSDHLAEAHNTQVPTNNEILEIIRKKSEEIKDQRGLKKSETLKLIGECIKPHIELVRTFLM